MSNALERVAIVGVGYSQVGRRLPLSDDELVRQAITAAMDDAGLEVADIDGISTMGGDAMRMGHLLGIMPLNFFFTSSQLAPAFAEPAVMAIASVASGLSHTCVAVRLIRQLGPANPAARGDEEAAGPRPPAHVSGDAQFSAPFGGGAPAPTIGGLQMQRHMAQYGTTELHFAHNAVTARSHAALNSDAIFRDPLTVEDYLSSRYVSKPLRLLDCDYPVDSASAVIFTTEARARDRRSKPVMVESYALSAVRDFDMALLDDFVRNATVTCADSLWSRTDLTPADVDCAQLYDGFSVITFEWLEALGFCGPGEAGPFVAEGNTRLGGRLPLNTDGGACNVGRRHGANFCIEAVRQLRGECGERQVPGAEVAVWSNGVGVFAGAVLLTA
ncbi:MAG TPA: thiolase family protein [Acidimicrobiales bacterium]|nr:thiolase family protein [Acidimicrobiales bacterium]